MKGMRLMLGCWAMLASVGFATDSFIDRLDEALTVSAFQDDLRVRLSGTLDLEGYRLQQPSPGLLYTDGDTLFNPRLALFLDAQAGRQIYVFAQARADRGFDPSDEGFEMRLDEFAIRFTPVDSRFNVQVGKFATVVGNWVPRHGSWENAFVTAPLPYENLTALWNVVAARFPEKVLAWAHLRPNGGLGAEYAEKRYRTPIIWGPSYARGAAVFGEVEKFQYAIEVKNGSLSSHPGTWDGDNDGWRHPTVSGRLGYRPNAMWNFGVSASSGPYLRPLAAPTFATGRHLGDYRETVIAQDIGFAWHHWQLWAEFYEARFAIPNVGNAETFSYYTEARYKLTPRFFAAVRWNQQFFGSLPDSSGGSFRWGRDIWRIDFAPTYRFTPHVQLKLQYSWQRESDRSRTYSQLFASQLVMRF